MALSDADLRSIAAHQEPRVLLHHEVVDFARASEAAARQKALKEAAEACAEISKDYWMGDAQFEAAIAAYKEDKP